MRNKLFLFLVILINFYSCAQTKGIEKYDDFGDHFFNLDRTNNLDSISIIKLNCLNLNLVKHNAIPKNIVFIAHNYSSDSLKTQYQKFIKFKSEVLLYLAQKNKKWYSVYNCFYWGSESNKKNNHLGVDIQVYFDAKIEGELIENILFDFSHCNNDREKKVSN